MDYETIIGLEVHAHLSTKSKMFCGCSSKYQDASPNSFVCPVCMGMPGILPVTNQKAIDLVVKTGLALSCKIAHETKFDRKNYPYPDLMKGYQISQYDRPVATGGKLEVDTNGELNMIRITRVHLEEDVAKLVHRNQPNNEGYSLLDMNRAGLPLMEIVSEPDLRSPDEARNYLIKLRSILRYLEVSTANMEEGSFRCDANISLRPYGSTQLGVKVEIKNMNSFRSVHRALEYEIKRQTHKMQKDERIIQETRGWIETRAITVSQRTKEYASDYRYFPEPDLPPIVIDPSKIDAIAKTLPELPHQKKLRFINEYELSHYDANQLTSSKATADFFETVLNSPKSPSSSASKFAKAVSNWILGELTRLLNANQQTLAQIKITPSNLAELVLLVQKGTLNSGMAKTVFEEMFATGQTAIEIIERSDMVQIADSELILTTIKEIIKDNPEPATDYLNGKEKALKYLIGQVMKITKGKIDPILVSQLLQEQLMETNNQ